MTRWGIWDSVDLCWVGTNVAGTGPQTLGAGDDYRTDSGSMGTLDDSGAKSIVRVAADVACVQLGWPRGRCVVREYDGSGTQVKDELPTVRSGDAALRKLEDGSI